MFRSSRCVEAVFENLQVQYDKTNDQEMDIYLTGIGLENIDGFTFAFQCIDENEIQMFAVLVEDVEEKKVERLIEELGEINRHLRFFSLFLDDNNNVVLGYTYFMVSSFEESVQQVISLMNSTMQAIDAFIPDVMTYV